VRIIGSSGAALDRAAHPVLGARFSRPARPWRKLQCLRKGMRNVLCNRRTTRALKRVFTKNTGVRMCTVTVVTGKIHHRVTVKGLGKKDPRACGSGYRQNNPQFESGNEGRSRLCERQKTGTSADSRCENQNVKGRLESAPTIENKACLSRNPDRRERIYMLCMLFHATRSRMYPVKLRRARREPAKFAAPFATSVESLGCAGPLLEDTAANCPFEFRLEKRHAE
jgi:hypothetical protein